MGFGESNSSLGGIATRLRQVIAGRASAFLHPTTPGQARTSEHVDAPDIPDLELLRRIGHGSYGEVWLARNIVGSYRAVKIIDRKAFRDEETFEREFLGLQGFEPISREHAGFVEILHVGRNRADGFFYYVMELADDDSNGHQIDPDTYVPKTLSSELAGRGRLSVRESVQLGLSLTDALMQLHQHGLVHRDIKPSNIIFVKGRPKLADIGLVAHVGEKKRLGTEGYIPPEGPGTAQSDLYSLGKLLYEASTGTDRLDYPDLPRDLDTMAERETFLQLNSIILKACDNDVTKRYRTAREVKDDLAQLGVLEKPVQAVRRNLRRNRIIALSIVSLVTLTTAVSMLVWKNNFFYSAPPKSIAVLPFENLSGDKQDSYLADGIQEEILTRLASITELRVLSSMSTQRYKGKRNELSAIAKRLGVANILEGSVQKTADKVRVSVQLVKAQTNSQIWNKIYERKVTNIFGVASDVAKGTAGSLQAKLSGREEEVMAAKPTNISEAYDVYLRALAFEARSSYSMELMWKVTSAYEQAVQLDPNFALAWARLSRADALLYFSRGDTSAARRDAAERALKRAQELQPNSPETLLALGYYQYWVLREYSSAETTFKLVRKLSPGSSEVPRALGGIALREGRWNESIAYREEALEMDPANVAFLSDTALTYAMLRQFPAALKLYDRALDLTPNDPDLMAVKASIYQAEGDLREAAKFLTEINAQTPSGTAVGIKVNQLRLERNLAEAIRLLKDREVHYHFGSDREKCVNELMLALVQRVDGNVAGTQAAAEQARHTLEPLCRNQPTNAYVVAMSSLASSVLGQRDLAIEEAERAITLLPASQDRVFGPTREENLALVQMMLGENGLATSNLSRLVQTPYSSWLYSPIPLTRMLLTLDPLWDPLRTDPAFKKLCEEKQQ